MHLRDWMMSDHAGVMGRFDQAIVAHVPRARWTERVDGGGSSIAALLHHLVRHQDLAVHVAVGGADALWSSHVADLGLAGASPSAGLGETEDPTVTARLDLEALVTYARAVHDATQTWLAHWGDDGSLEGLLDEVPATGAHLEAVGVTQSDVPWLHSMWGPRTVGWLLQWPGIGHGHAHVGEATSIRNRMGLSPF
jgi:hypothetical protein